MTDDMPLDPEEATLAELEEAESAAPADDAAGEAAAVPDEPDAAPPEPSAAPTEEIRIPKPRLDAVLGRARELELENARLKGIVEAGLRTQPDEVSPESRSNPVADRLIALEAAKDALWDRYDKGEIAFAEMKKAERRLDGEAGQIREAIRQHRATAAPPDVNGDLRLNELTQDLAVRNTWLGYIPPDYMVQSVMPLAERLLAQRGVPLSNDPAGAYRLRQATVDVARAMGAYRLFAPRELWPEEGAPAVPAPIRPASQLSPKEVQEKLLLARRHPPDASGIGTRLAHELLSPKDIDGMSEEELAQLSDADLERLAPSRAG